jgi:hypothetical protein
MRVGDKKTIGEHDTELCNKSSRVSHIQKQFRKESTREYHSDADRVNKLGAVHSNVDTTSRPEIPSNTNTIDQSSFAADQQEAKTHGQLIVLVLPLTFVQPVTPVMIGTVSCHRHHTAHRAKGNELRFPNPRFSSSGTVRRTG